ncbi:MAG: hypothetical protein A2Z25_04060 [Planctomycetes bacterium RBG_16_55_9]|nr:MAG: hypothetical protein A2Z25_04060 [Planctomycetes bacterium RBG_16_55_9]
MDIRSKRIAILSPVAWRTPPRAYGAWGKVACNITEGLVARGWKNVTLFAAVDRGLSSCHSALDAESTFSILDPCPRRDDNL